LTHSNYRASGERTHSSYENEKERERTCSGRATPAEFSKKSDKEDRKGLEDCGSQAKDDETNSEDDPSIVKGDLGDAVNQM